MLVTIARYRAITGDTVTQSVTVSAKIEQATDLLADALCREVEQASRTETLWPTRDGRLWPSCTPIASNADGYTIDGHGLIGVFGPAWPNSSGSVDVTYVGGWLERSANPGSPYALPSYIESDLAWAAWTLRDPDTSAAQYPAGATSVRLGDAAVTFGPDGPPRPGAGSVRWSRPTMRHRYHTVRGAGSLPC